ncbi:MAG: cytochrome c biogenesis protein CcsA, partial [Prolixibacteraceae bacterium]|nr:cytochrome c biogenesis protein CcsA [Prolixibacteraceae bacterium]
PIQPNGRNIYQIKNISFVFKQFYPAGRVQLTYMPQENGGFSYDAFLAKITVENESTEITVSGTNGMVGEPHYVFLSGAEIKISYGSKNIELPFSLKLNDFQLDRYPGSNSPSSYASEVVLIDKNDGIEKPFRIFMNNILKYKGFRFFQSSYDQDEMGTVLSVNNDLIGTSVTYFGYLILAIGMVLTLFNRNSRFKKLIRASAKLHEEKKKLLMVFLIGFSGILLSAQSSAQERLDKNHVQEFSQLLIQNNRGRIEPVNTLASDILRKVAKKSNINGIPAAEVFLEMNINPEKWKNIPLIKVANPELRSRLGATGNMVAFNKIVTSQQSGGYRLSQMVQQAYAVSPAKRNKLDKEIINVDERVNILMNVFLGNFLTIFPIPNHENNKWVSYQNTSSLGENAEWAENTYNQYFSSIIQAKQNGDWRSPNGYLKLLKENQNKYASHIVPSDTKIKLEVFYNNFNIFGKLSKFYLIIGFSLLILQFITLFNPKTKTEKLKMVGVIFAILLFTAHTAGLALRWYISGHAPWSNGYESMIFVGWATALSGLIFIKRSQITLAMTLVLAALTLLVAGMSWMSPEITDLVPVLKSYWLIVHVAIITASYGFLGISALLGTLNLILIITRSEKNNTRINLTIKELAYIIQIALIIGLYMITIGSFIGGVWANESWGRYWGWDPKETWALVTVLVYSFIIHMHKIKGFRGTFALSTAALVSFSSVLMTYFGVNYYLSGLHSYAQGEPAPVPTGVYIAVIVVFLLILSAYYYEKMWKTKTKMLSIPDIDIDNPE